MPTEHDFAPKKKMIYAHTPPWDGFEDHCTHNSENHQPCNHMDLLCDYDKTDQGYARLSGEGTWHTVDGLDPKLVAAGERFLANRKGLDQAWDTPKYQQQGFEELKTLAKAIPAPRVDYYDAGGIGVIEYIKAKLSPEQYKGFLLGNCLKYASRLQHKGDPKGDSKKLATYSRWLEELK